MSQILHSKIVGKGKPLIILHGLLGMGDNWISLAKQYAKLGFEVHLIDQRNHGKSFHNDEMNYEVMADDLIAYFKHHNIQKANIIGHSMGGKTAMHFALQHPDLVEKLIIVDIAPKYYPPHHHFIFEAINSLKLSKYKNRREIETALSKKITSKAIVLFLLKNITRDQDGRFFWKPNISILEDALEDLGEALPPLSTLHIPVLFIKGEKSKYILPEDFSLIKAHFPSSTIEIIYNAGHWVHAEQPQLFLKNTIDFLVNEKN